MLVTNLIQIQAGMANLGASLYLLEVFRRNSNS